MKNNDNILSLLKLKDVKSESGKSFNFDVLMNKVTQKETDTHLIVRNFPSAFGDTQNKNNRIYDQPSLKEASRQYNEVLADNAYFGYMFDGHKDEDSYENIIGRVLKTKIDEEHKCILSDLKINKGAKAYPTIANIVKDGDPLGISMRIISPNTLYLDKDELQELNPDIMQLDEDNACIAQIMGKDEEIEYISGDAYIQRLDLTWFPSFNNSYVEDKRKSKDESAISNFTEYKESSCLLSNKERCTTDSCRFKTTVKDFIHLISTDESITTIKDNPKLYDDMLKFSYMNLSEFDFDKMTDSKYLKERLDDFKLDKEDLDEWIDTISKIAGNDNLLKYIIAGDKVEVNRYIQLLNKTLTKIIDVDDIFYQIVTTNYLHQTALSSLILSGKDTKIIKNTDKLYDDLAENASIKDDNNDVLFTLLDGIKEDTNVYDFTNHMFTYIYGYLDKYSTMTAPISIVNESFKRFKVLSTKSLFKQSFVKK